VISVFTESNVNSLYVFLYTVLTWRWPTWVETCSFNKYHNLVVYICYSSLIVDPAWISTICTFHGLVRLYMLLINTRCLNICLLFSSDIEKNWGLRVAIWQIKQKVPLCLCAPTERIWRIMQVVHYFATVGNFAEFLFYCINNL
jgi:hypothetical protein